MNDFGAGGDKSFSQTEKSNQFMDQNRSNPKIVSIYTQLNYNIQ